MEPKEYFIAVTRELDAVRTPDNLNVRDVIHFIWNLWERNIAPEIAAIWLIEKFGYKLVNSDLN